MLYYDYAPAFGPIHFLIYEIIVQRLECWEILET